MTELIYYIIIFLVSLIVGFIFGFYLSTMSSSTKHPIVATILFYASSVIIGSGVGIALHLLLY